VLIQFGHNDQPGKGPERETDPKTTFPEHLARYVDEARQAGAQPILVTPMTRRNFNREGKIESTLTPYADAVKKVAQEKKLPLVARPAGSTEAVERMGPEEAAVPTPATAAPTRPDRTHLSPRGAAIMARLVAEELRTVEPRFRPLLPAFPGREP